MPIDRSRPSRGGPLLPLRVRWGALSGLGLGVGMTAGVLLLGPAESVVGMVLVVPAAFAIAGAILGASQWFAVRYLARPAPWICLTAVGLGAGLTLATISIEVLGGWLAGGPVRLGTASVPGLLAAFLVLGAISGLAIGAAQWICLRHRFAGGRGWIAANGASLALGMPAGVAAAELVGGVATPLGLVVLFSVAAGVCGLVTGRVLERRAREAARAFRLSGV